jgi:hypothetical protein
VLVALNGFRGLWYVYVFRFLILFSSIIPIRSVLKPFPLDFDLTQVTPGQFAGELGHGEDGICLSDYE